MLRPHDETPPSILFLRYRPKWLSVNHAGFRFGNGAKFKFRERVGQAEPNRVNRGRRLLIPRLDVCLPETVADLIIEPLKNEAELSQPPDYLAARAGLRFRLPHLVLNGWVYPRKGPKRDIGFRQDAAWLMGLECGQKPDMPSTSEIPAVSQTLVRETLAKHQDLLSNLYQNPFHIQRFSKALRRSGETGRHVRHRHRAFLVTAGTVGTGVSPQNHASKKGDLWGEENANFLKHIRCLVKILPDYVPSSATSVVADAREPAILIRHAAC